MIAARYASLLAFAQARGFCPTGEGGGRDNSCGPGGVKATTAPDKGSGGGAASPSPYKQFSSEKEALEAAVGRWKGQTTDLGIHIQDETEGAPSPSSASGEKLREMAAALLKEVKENSRPAPTLYRGDDKTTDANSSVLVGWTSNRRVAEKWAKKYGGEVQTLEGASGVRLADIVGKTRDMGEDEWVVLNTPKPDSYRGRHAAPTPDRGSPSHDLSAGAFPEDIYGPDAARLYGHGDPAIDDKAVRVIQSIRGKPDAKVNVYRAVPKSTAEINPGDWVSITPEYAKQHGEATLGGEHKVISKTVKASEIFNDGNSIHEWGYSPTRKSDRRASPLAFAQARDANCAREPDGKFGKGNDCQQDGGGGENSSPSKPNWMGQTDASGATRHGDWFLERNTKQHESPGHGDVTTHVVSLVDASGNVKAFAHADLSDDKSTLYMNYGHVAEPHRGQGVYKSLLESLSEQFRVVSDEEHNVAPAAKKAYESLGARLDRYGHYVLEKKQKRSFEHRSADCAREPDGKFGDGNKCQRPTIGININDSNQDFTVQILSGEKTTETRITDSLAPYVGKTVGIVRTGKGKATLVGTMKVGKPKFYKTAKEFDADFDKHKIGPDSPHYIGPEGKYGYPLSEVKPVKPVRLDSKGIVARVIHASSRCVTVEYHLGAERRDDDCGRDENGRFTSGNKCGSFETMGSPKEDPRGRLRYDDGTQTDAARKMYQMGVSEKKLRGLVEAMGGDPKSTTVDINPPSINVSVSDKDGKRLFFIDAENGRASIYPTRDLGGDEIAAIRDAAKQTFPVDTEQKGKSYRLTVFRKASDMQKWEKKNAAKLQKWEDKYKFSTELPPHQRPKKWERSFEHRDADCNRDPNGRFGEDNNCQKEGSGSTALGEYVPPISPEWGMDEKPWGESGEKVEVYTPDDPLFRGAESISEITVRTQGLKEALTSTGLSLPRAIRAAGIRPGSLAEAGVGELSVRVEALKVRGRDSVLVQWTAANTDARDVNKYAVEAVRYISKNDKGELEITADSFFIHPRFQGRGIALEMMRGMVNSGARRIRMPAAGRRDGAGVLEDEIMTGYCDWPKYGYDCPIAHALSVSRRRTLPPQFSEARTLLDVYSLPGGREWWRKDGDGVTLEFDCTPGSKSLRVFYAYEADTKRKLSRRSKAKDDRPIVGTDCDYDPVLDAVWDKIVKDGGFRTEQSRSTTARHAALLAFAQSRDADCTRNPDGTFGSGNKCQEEGDGPALDVESSHPREYWTEGDKKETFTVVKTASGDVPVLDRRDIGTPDYLDEIECHGRDCGLSVTFDDAKELQGDNSKSPYRSVIAPDWSPLDCYIGKAYGYFTGNHDGAEGADEAIDFHGAAEYGAIDDYQANDIRAQKREEIKQAWEDLDKTSEYGEKWSSMTDEEKDEAKEEWFGEQESFMEEEIEDLRSDARGKAVEAMKRDLESALAYETLDCCLQLYRGIRAESAEVDRILSEGYVTHDSVNSWTTSRGTARSFGANKLLLVVRRPRVGYVFAPNTHDEAEIVRPPSKMKITGAVRTKTGTVLYVDEDEDYLQMHGRHA